MHDVDFLIADALVIKFQSMDHEALRSNFAHIDLSVKFHSHHSRDYTNHLRPITSSAIDASGQVNHEEIYISICDITEQAGCLYERPK
ncbi:polypyrimidine tract-binding homolog 2 [Olea europaea subsp. europaea]|uniref:Polypyrimidine tract-binding homolog 2 n=2 Tax=Olea europaea subsp. europaea TaxID=158383 RepID=A0A8S0QS69_OLEEU|nr:polypyrimidine tract-binding homolog 2 [Olea europaea subsp. europaea]